MSFFFGAMTDVLEEVAKFRAARRLWARIVKERFGAKDPRSCMLRFHTQTCGATLTAQQVDNNVVRVTLQALAAVLGAVHSHCIPTVETKPSPCPRRKPPNWRCGRSRSSHTNRA